MYRQNLKNITGALAAFIITGCASQPHNDVLIFGTETTLALDVGTSASNGGTPAITVGYKRQEAVWMPLIANGQGTKVPPTTNQLYQGKGDKPSNQDAYSVFASFGAQLEGKTGNAKVGLAQFFATGIAAQKLSSNPASVLALTVKSEEQGKADANAVAAVAGASESAELGQKLLEEELSEADKVLDCMKRHGLNRYIEPDANLPAGWGPSLKANYKPQLLRISNKTDLLRFYSNFKGTEAQIKSKTASCPS